MKTKISVTNTNAETFVDDADRSLSGAGIDQHFDSKQQTLLKVNISWQYYYPACSTTPWQLEAAIKSLRGHGFNNLLSVHNGTVVVDPVEGAQNNKHVNVEDKLAVPNIFLDFPSTKWVIHKPKKKLLVLDNIFPEGIYIPEVLIGKNILHLPTAKTHVFTTITGAMKNAFGGLLNHRRHWTHSVIHETLVDLLTIQKEIHTGVFAMIDGTLAGDGPGPRAMQWHEKNLIISGADQVAVDAVMAKIMGFDPMSIKFINLAHTQGLGCGDVKEIEIFGEDIEKINWHFKSNQDTFASWGQKLIYWGPLKKLETFLLRTPVVLWAFWASNLYHNQYWLRFIGNKRVRSAMKTQWGKLFNRY